MTDNEIIKASGEVSCNKIKAIYPHIVVSGDVDKPYYSIQWYDIKKKTMFDGYASYKLALVKKWLQENFEATDDDIGDFINRQQEEIERLSDRNHKCIYLSDDETTEYCVDGPCPKFKTEAQIKAEAIKEFAQSAKDLAYKKSHSDKEIYSWYEDIDNLVKEMAGEK